MSVRTYLAAQIKPAVTALGWAFYDHDRTLGQIGKVTALLVHTRVEPAPQHGGLQHTVALVIVDPTQAEKTADDHLDDHLEDLIPVLRAIPNVQFTEAEKATREGFPAWLVNLTVQTT